MLKLDKKKGSIILFKMYKVIKNHNKIYKMRKINN